jgi:inosine-uridine nucleoside N-ribohydrolase
MIGKAVRAWALGLLGGVSLATAAQAAEPKLVIYDNDFFGAATTDILPLIGDPDIKVLGVTVVTGDGWLDEETSYVLRALEIAGRTDIPVVKGALFPLVNSAARTRAWEQAYGKIVWKGAWNDPVAYPGSHPDDPHAVTPDPAGAPKAQATPGEAAEFLIQQVHRYPHQVTIIAAGPLTNIALAIRLDPQFASLAKELVFMGGFVDTNLQQVTGDADYATDFNIWFDPEAADITLTAPWAKITNVGAISNDIAMTPALKARIAAKNTPVTALVAQYALPLPLWDELTTAIVADPSLVTKAVDANMDVDVDHGLYYGVTHVWPDKTTPHMGERKVHIVQSIDAARFEQLLVDSAQRAAVPGR